MDPATSSGVYIFHSPEVISAIISALAGIIMGFFGWLAGKSNRTAKKALWEDQLKNLYEPLDYLLSFSYKNSAYELLHEIRNLISKNYRFLTPDIQKEINRLCIMENVSASDMEDLKLMVSSTYNWLRKKLSYPYNKASILRSTVLIYIKRTHTIGTMLPLLLAICSALLTSTSLMYLDGSEIVPPPANEVLTSTLGTLFIMIPFVLAIFIFLEEIIDVLGFSLRRITKLFLRALIRIRGKDKG